MNPTWIERLADYLDQLQAICETIDLILDNVNVNTVALHHAEVERSTTELTQALKELESKVAERDELLRAEDAPQIGSSLTEKLRRSNHIDRERLITRCDQIAETIGMANQRAVSLFVCQYHLVDTSNHIIRLLSGVLTPPTYGDEPNQHSHHGGALFNEAG